jgi:hypothetical protein
LEAGSCLFACDDGVGAFDAEAEEVVGVSEVVDEVEVVEVVGLAELWLDVGKADEAAELDTDETGDEAA